jgi:hypothetical protein
LGDVWLFPLAKSAQCVSNDSHLRIELRSVGKMGEIAAATTLDDMRTHGFNATRRRFEHPNDSTVFASLTFDNRNLKAFAWESTIDKDHTSVLAA